MSCSLVGCASVLHNAACFHTVKGRKEPRDFTLRSASQLNFTHVTGPSSDNAKIYVLFCFSFTYIVSQSTTRLPCPTTMAHSPMPAISLHLYVEQCHPGFHVAKLTPLADCTNKVPTPILSSFAVTSVTTSTRTLFAYNRAGLPRPVVKELSRFA